MNKLTNKQTKFCENIALRGMNQSDAYRDAYDAENMKSETIKEKASRIAAQYNIGTTIDELKAKVQEKTLEKFSKSREKILQELEDLIVFAKKENNIKEMRKCLIEQGKLLGYYVEKKIETNEKAHEKWLKMMEKKK